MANILCGLQAHSSAHPCYWCDIDSKNQENSGNLRALGSLKARLRFFRNSGSILVKAKMTGNVIHEPIISGLMANSSLTSFLPLNWTFYWVLSTICLKHPRASGLMLNCGLHPSTSNRVHNMEVSSKEMNVKN